MAGTGIITVKDAPHHPRSAPLQVYLVALLTLSTLVTPFTAGAQTLAARIAEVLSRAGNGHSPTNEEIAAAAVTSDPTPPKADIQSALPLLLKALDDRDAPVRTYALTALAALQYAAPPPASDPTTDPASAATAPATTAPATTAPAPLPPPPPTNPKRPASLPVPSHRSPPTLPTSFPPTAPSQLTSSADSPPTLPPPCTRPSSLI